MLLNALSISISSKDKLILEVMLYREKQWLQWFEESIAQRGKTAKDKLLATFDVLGSGMPNQTSEGVH